MAPFIFTERGGVHIFDLAKTEEGLERALKIVRSIASSGGKILFIGTKKQAQTIVQDAAISAGMPFVTERWLGGMLTNFDTVLSQLKTLKELDEKIENNLFTTKKQLVVASKQAKKLKSNLGGIETMNKIPDAVFIIDVSKESNAVKEANKLGIPVIAIVDSNANPDAIDYVIPGNDDAVKSIMLFCSELARVINENKPVPKKEETIIQEN
jgi:small subunit ribosomal protein S2